MAKSSVMMTGGGEVQELLCRLQIFSERLEDTASWVILSLCTARKGMSGMMLKGLAQRQHGLETFPDRKTLAWGVDLHGIAQKLAHSPALHLDGCLVRSILDQSGAVDAQRRPVLSVTAAISAGRGLDAVSS
ncbi:hypothetical protein [Salipiger sp. PrR002]|uniref:hypothetical protein n=1 Tax=Salipiger sp. PrR002 TaxID=2706489 RepID=UPI0013B72E7C|nr:hypothetical protein [Salipiger sp. PrR002]NDW02651.1 hypothetical protein [Salipiger sp. PrR002]NDW60022.1 hypothetical protein [Salipiger sp. PrR004]